MLVAAIACLVAPFASMRHGRGESNWAATFAAAPVLADDCPPLVLNPKGGFNGPTALNVGKVRVGQNWQVTLTASGGPSDTTTYLWQFINYPPWVHIDFSKDPAKSITISGTPTKDQLEFDPVFGNPATWLNLILVYPMRGTTVLCGPTPDDVTVTVTGRQFNGTTQNRGQGPVNPCPPCKGAGDPVTVSSGQVTQDVVDLRIPGRGFDYTFERGYDSGSGLLGPLGFNWDFNYNRRLIVSNATNLTDIQVQFPSAKVGDVERVDGGAGRADLYVANSDESYTAPPGFFTALSRNPDGTFVERDRSGWAWSYASADPASGIAPMTAMSDRHGNTMGFQHDFAGRLSTVIDTLGRPITYSYNPDGLLSSITDFTGRTIRFGYTDNWYLTSVTSPAVTGTPNGNDFPKGRTTQYTYLEGGALNGDLTSIESPNQVAAGIGSSAARVQYNYEFSRSSPDFGKVISQTDGATVNGLPAGGTIHYAYQSLPGNPSDPNSAVSQTTVTDRNGNQTIYQFDSFGSVLLQRELTNRNVDPSEPGPFDTTYTYNKDDQTISETDPLGNSTQYTYVSSNPDRFQQGNRLSITHIPDAKRSGDQKALTTTYTYEPIYNQVRTVTDPRGNDPSYVPQNGGTTSPARYTTTSTFDYEESCDFAAIGSKIGVSAQQAQELLARAGMCQKPLGDVNGDGVTNQVDGNVIRIAAPTVHLGPACPAPKLTQTSINCSLQARQEGTSTQPIVSLSSYNQYGQRTQTVDPEGNVTAYSYYPSTDPDRDGVVENPGGNATTGGYLKQRIVDAVAASARDSRTNPTPAAIPTLYFYDQAGNVTRTVDGRGIATDYSYNQLDELVQITRAAAHNVFTPHPAEPQPLTDFQYLQRRFYDYDGNLVLSQVEDRGDTSGAAGPPAAADLPATAPNPNPATGPSFIDTVHKYDVLDQLIQTVHTVRNGSNPLFLYTNYRYDPNGNLVLLIEPAGNTTSSVYDERNQLYQTTAGATGPPPLALLAPSDPTSYDVRGGVPETTNYHHDANGNPTAIVDGNGHTTRYIYDGFGRLTSMVDPVGNQTVRQYDPAGSVVRIAHFGPIGGSSPASGPATLAEPVSLNGIIQVRNLVTPNLLSATAYRYDELSRQYQTDQSLFVTTQPTMRPADVQPGAASLAKLNLNPTGTCAVPGAVAPRGGWLGCISSRTEYDRNGRATFAINDEGDVASSQFDGANRVMQTIDRGGNMLQTAYDGDGNIIETRRTDVSQILALAREIFLDTNYYDSLNRLIETVDNLGQTQYYQYDSRDNLVATADAKGPPGPTIARRTFPNGPRTVNVTNLPGNITTYTYDGLSRTISQASVLTKSGAGDGTFTPTPDTGQGGGDGLITLTYGYDANSLPASQTDDNGNQTQYAYDNADRTVKQTIGICVAPNLASKCVGPKSSTYSFDAAGLLISMTDYNGSVTHYAYDSANRLISTSIQRAPGVAGSTATSHQYDGLSRLTSAFDNNNPTAATDGVTMTRSYDSLGRTIEERQQIGNSPGLAVDRAWRGDGLRSSLTYPNGRVVDYTYDANDRLATLGDAGASKPLATYSYIGPDRLLQRTYPISGDKLTYLNGAGTQDVGYDGLGRPTQIKAVGPTGNLILGYGYSFDRNSNPLSKSALQAPNLSELYKYDSASRLISFNRGTLNSSGTAITTPSALKPLQSSFTLDGVGNWVKVDGQTRTFSSYNAILSLSSGGKTTTLTTDANGNTLSSGAFTYAWDAQNRLRTVTRNSDHKLIATYLYDASGRRVEKIVTNSGASNGTTRYLPDGYDEIEERDGANKLLQQYVYGPGIDDPIVLDRNTGGGATATGPGDQRLFYLQDAQGSVVGLTDTSGKLVEGYVYDAYGRPTVYDAGKNGVIDWGKNDTIRPSGSSAFGNPFLFTGQRYDGETGLYYDRARYMDPVLGRFISMDPIGAWGDPAAAGNGYGYVGDSPVTGTDPSGLLDKVWWEGFFKGLDEVLGSPSNLVLPLNAQRPSDLSDLRTSAKAGALALADMYTGGLSKTVKDAKNRAQDDMLMSDTAKTVHNVCAWVTATDIDILATRGLGRILGARAGGRVAAAGAKLAAAEAESEKAQQAALRAFARYEAREEAYRDTVEWVGKWSRAAGIAGKRVGRAWVPYVNRLIRAQDALEAAESQLQAASRLQQTVNSVPRTGLGLGLGGAQGGASWWNGGRDCGCESSNDDPLWLVHPPGYSIWPDPNNPYVLWNDKGQLALYDTRSGQWIDTTTGKVLPTPLDTLLGSKR